MIRGLITAAFLLTLLTWLAVPATGSDAVIDGTFSTGTFGQAASQYFMYWDIVGAGWPMWYWEPYDTTKSGVEDQCFRFLPKTGQESKLYQDIYLIEGQSYEVSLDICFHNT